MAVRRRIIKEVLENYWIMINICNIVNHSKRTAIWFEKLHFCIKHIKHTRRLVLCWIPSFTAYTVIITQCTFPNYPRELFQDSCIKIFKRQIYLI